MSIAQSLACTKPSCPCQKTARTENGVTHCPVPGHGKGQGDNSPSLSLAVKDDGKELFHCHAGCTNEEVISALKGLGLWADPAPRGQRRREEKAGAKKREWIATHAATLQYVSTKIRIDEPGKPKKYHWEPKLAGVKVADLSLYRHENAKIWRKEHIVVICEGEPKTDALANLEMELGVVVVGTVTGSSTIPGDAALDFLAGRTVLLWPDNDEPGYRHMTKIATRLHDLGAKKIGMIDWPDAPDTGDADDAIKAGVDIGELIANALARQWQPTTFDLVDFLEKVGRTLRRFVLLNEHQTTAIALWVAHTHAFEAAECTPYLSISSVEKQSGKTRLLEVLEFLVAYAWLTARTSAAALKNKISAHHPTLLLDESDTAFKSDKEYAEALRNILNSGYRKRGVYSTSVKVNGNWVNKDFSTFCPKAIAGIGNLPDTVADRSIPIQMKRAAPSEKVEAFRERDARPELEPIQAALSEWAAWHIDALEAARPDMPRALSDRAMDTWEPLMAIADLAGEGWPRRAREAAVALSSREFTDADSLRVRLLRDIKGIFEKTGFIRIPTPTLVDALVDIDVAPWGDLRGKPLDHRSLARMLKDFPIKPIIWKEGDHTVRGYHKDDFLDAWSRYVVGTETVETTETNDEPESDKVSMVSVVSDKSGGESEGGAERWKLQLS